MNYQWGSIFSALPNVVLVNSRTHEVELGLTELESQHQLFSPSFSLSVSLGFFQSLCSFFPLTFHPHSLLICLQVHYVGYSNWSLQPFLPPSLTPRATAMGVCMSYAQDSVLRTWFNAGLLPALNFYLFIYFWSFKGACWILIPGPGMELGPRSECAKPLDRQRIALKFLVTLSLSFCKWSLMGWRSRLMSRRCSLLSHSCTTSTVLHVWWIPMDLWCPVIHETQSQYKANSWCLQLHKQGRWLSRQGVLSVQTRTRF